MTKQDFLHGFLPAIEIENGTHTVSSTIRHCLQRGSEIPDRLLPGRRYMRLDEPTREALKNLKSDELAKMRYPHF